MSYIEYVHARPSFDGILTGLQKALHFSADDLDANRMGKIGPDQKPDLLRRAVIPPLICVAAGICISIILRLLWAGFAENRNVFSYAVTLLVEIFTLDLGGLYRDYVKVGGEDMPRLVRAILMIPIGWSLLHIHKRSFDSIADLIRGVDCVEGSVELAVEEKVTKKVGNLPDEVHFYFFEVNKLRYPVPPEAKDVLVFGLHYRIYFGKGSRTVVSAEPTEYVTSETGELTVARRSDIK